MMIKWVLSWDGFLPEMVLPVPREPVLGLLLVLIGNAT